MSLDVRFLLTMCCIFPAIVGIIKYKRVAKLFHPFIFLMWLEVVIEIFNYICDKKILSNGLHYTGLNSYILLNFFLFLLFVYNFNFITKNKLKILFIIAIIIGIVNFAVINYSGMTFYLLFYVSIIMLAIAIDILTKQIMAIKQSLVNNFWFWMSSTSIIYNAQALLIFSTFYFVLPGSKILGNIFTIINALCYILFGIGMLNIPIKNKK